ncbi:glycosyltransferase family 2 protein [Heyndrickxia acidicola]|uniref:Glycosyltransferase n=1 Tax=Heyndrickxia acidicola TaxID=209389 RepID=A0ABU6MKJ3_9BACI|nr:glycosyltransferase [Heyndrickxia acidicola]MED1205204.1 glycosyltransferase [Heyndrickxia acidicola]
MDQKVSIVVPIYNVEDYVNRCITSILHQTYSNLEIILVNDGSTDNSGRIAENFAKADSRIKVLHQKNGGLSDARNTGIKQVTGAFTCFIDSDDWIKPDMIQVMLYTANKWNADVVQSAFYYAYNHYTLFDNRNFRQELPPILLDNHQLMKELVINERVKDFAWGKLYKTELIRDLPFKKGVLFEDVFWSHQVLHRVGTYAMVQQPYYYYLQRNSSIVATYSLKHLDMIKGLQERQKFIEKHYKDLSLEAYKVLLKALLIHYNLLVMNKKKDKDGRYRKEIQTAILKDYETFLLASYNEKHLENQLKLFAQHPYINIFYLALCKFTNKLRYRSKEIGMEKANL